LDLQINNIDSNSATFTSPPLISNFVNGETTDLFSDLFEAIAKLSVEQQCSVVSEQRYFEPMFSGATMLIVSKPTAHFRSTSFLNSRGFHSFLFKGQKRWIIFPPDRLPENGFDTTQLLETILSSNLSKLNEHEHAFVVVQNENESVYVPEGWFYSYEVLNSSLSASINYEASTFDSSSFYQFYKYAMEKLSLGEIPAAIKYFKLGLALNRNILLLEGLADALTANSQFLSAEEFFREALVLNPQFVSAYSKLIQLMVNHASKDISESIAELLQQAEKAGVRERVLLLVQDNL
jgi:tetratricopeptide (TPR) repeat protein